jgi:type I restriction enzyme R subunit
LQSVGAFSAETHVALQQAALPGKHRFLFEMATGTGKTLLSAAIAKLYLRTENAHRILFLVDRLELERQAEKNFTAYLAADGISTVIYTQKRQDWTKAQVVVTTIQSLATNNRFLTDFAPTDFQLIISDEAHRTISGNNRAIFEYFVGAKLGLTAAAQRPKRAIQFGCRIAKQLNRSFFGASCSGSGTAIVAGLGGDPK